MNVLGVHCGHNSSACLLIDGKLKWAIQEERLTNEKNKCGFPTKSIDKILQSTTAEINLVAVASKNPGSGLGRKERLEFFKNRNNLKYKIKDRLRSTPLYQRHIQKRQQLRIDQLSEFGFTEEDISFVEHHRCHAASAFFGSEWREDVLVLTNDGRGDKVCATVSIGKNGTLERIAEIPEGHSVGNIYALTTVSLGFIPLEHEYKLMGMAPYVTEQNWREEVADIFHSYLEVAGLGIKRRIPEKTYLALPRINNDLEYLRFDWISAGLQMFTEELLTDWIDNCIEETGHRHIVLSGGTFMNVKANKAIRELDAVEDVFVFPSCGDESNSIGAAYHVASQAGDEIEPLSDVYLGPAIDSSAAKSAINQSKFNCDYYEDIETKVAELLAGGNIVARCKGRMEFGARALGNRSILADPSDRDVVRIINDLIKERDFWMPFAPSILAERAEDYLAGYDGEEAEFMIQAFDTKESWKELIGAVQQADKTTRPQLVKEATNGEYYHLLKRFEDITGRGALLNTSFNLHGYPIVNGPERALWVFENSGLEYLALDDYLLTK